jgi:hypothetical protein
MRKESKERRREGGKAMDMAREGGEREGERGGGNRRQKLGFLRVSEGMPKRSGIGAEPGGGRGGIP